MKKSLTLISVILFAFILLQTRATAQENPGKVYWMITVEVPVGRLAEYHSFAQEELIPVQEKYGYNFIGSWQTIVGEIEQVISISEFENMEAYNNSRRSFLGSEEWKASIGKKVDSLVRSIKTRFLRAAPYSRIK